jgi:hypothetical protein
MPTIHAALGMVGRIERRARVRVPDAARLAVSAVASCCVMLAMRERSGIHHAFGTRSAVVGDGAAAIDAPE